MSKHKLNVEVNGSVGNVTFSKSVAARLQHKAEAAGQNIKDYLTRFLLLAAGLEADDDGAIVPITRKKLRAKVYGEDGRPGLTKQCPHCDQLVAVDKEDFGEPTDSDMVMREFLAKYNEAKVRSVAKAFRMTEQQLIALCCASAGRLPPACRVKGVNYYTIPDLARVVDEVISDLRNV